MGGGTSSGFIARGRRGSGRGPSARISGGRQQAQHQVGLAGEVEEVARVHVHVALLEEPGRPAPPRRGSRGLSAPPTSPPSGSTRLAGESCPAAAGGRAGCRSTRSRIGACSSSRRAEERRGRELHRGGDRQDRCPRPPRAARGPRDASGSGPVTAIQASLSWGRPQLFDSPPRVKVRASPSRARLETRRSSRAEGEVGEHLVGDEGEPLGRRPATRGRPARSASGRRRSGCRGSPRSPPACAGEGRRPPVIEVPAAVEVEGVAAHPPPSRGQPGTRTAGSPGRGTRTSSPGSHSSLKTKA